MTPRARSLKNLALALWWISLALPGIVLTSVAVFGLGILLLGWMAITQTVAWYANVLLIPSFRAFQKPDGARPVWVVLAALLALDTFRLKWAPTNEGGGISVVYGYGLGALLWSCSIFVLWIAIGQRMVEKAIEDDASTTRGRAFRNAGVLCLALLLGSTLVKGTIDRMHGNSYEQAHLDLTDFQEGGAALLKKGAVCGDGPLELTVLRYPAGPIDMSAAQKGDWWDSPLDLFARGAAVVRVDDFDFFLRKNSGAASFEARRSMGEPAARVKLQLKPERDAPRREKVLHIEVPSTGQEIAYVWRQTGTQKSRYDWLYETCPPATYPDQTEAKLLFRSMSLDDGPNKQFETLLQDIVAAEQGRVRNAFADVVSYQVGMAGECPSEVSLDDRFSGRGSSADMRRWVGKLGVPVRIGDVTHFEPRPGRDATVLCSEDFIYLVGWTSTEIPGQLDLKNEAKRELIVRKMHMEDASLVSIFKVPISTWIPSDPDGRSPTSIKATGLKEADQGLLVSLSVTWRMTLEPEERYPRELLLHLR